MASSTQAADGARSRLWALQAESWPHGDPNRALEHGLTPREAAREVVRRDHAHLRPNGAYLLSGSFARPFEEEIRRHERALAVIDRAGPGPHEDPEYLAMVLDEVAAVELTLERRSLFVRSTEDEADLNAIVLISAEQRERYEPGGHFRLRTVNIGDFDRVLVGTLPSPRLHGFAELAGSTHTVIPVSRGVLDAQYFAARAVVSLLSRFGQIGREPGLGAPYFVTPEPGLFDRMSADCDHEVSLLYRAVSSWLFDGRPQQPYPPELPPESHIEPIILLSTMAKRFVLAHEYAHVLLDILRPAGQWSPFDWIVSPRFRELRADSLAIRIVDESARRFDLTGPPESLPGAVLALSSFGIFRAAAQLALRGRVLPASEDHRHPPLPVRLRALSDFYRREIVTDRRILPIDSVASALELLAPSVLEQVERDVANGRRLHSVWQGGAELNK